jgi:uncharacterized protein YdcH (DUF465 family)
MDRTGESQPRTERSRLGTTPGITAARQEVCPMIVATADDRLTELEARHRQLHDEVNQLERRAFLTPDEQRLIADLKKQKLMAKDELYAARRAAQAC